MVAKDRQRALLRLLPGEDRRHRDRRRRRQGRGVSEPGRAGGELREVREPLGVDCAVALLEVDHRELVEEQEDDGRRRAHADRSRLRVTARDHELRGRRVEQEEREKEERRRPEHGQERARRAPAPGRHGDPDTDEHRAGDQHSRPVDARALERLDTEDRAEEAEEDQVQHLRGDLADERDQELDGEQHEGWPERDDEREEHDVGRRRAAHGEELGVLAEQVEQRLREREPGRRQELCTACSRNAQPTPPRDARELHVCDCHRQEVSLVQGMTARCR